MKKSIGVKLFLATTLFAVIIIGVLWVLNTKFLGGYYLERKKENFTKQSEYIKEIYEGDPQDIDGELEKIENNIGGYIIIITREGALVYSSSYREQNLAMGKGMMRGNNSNFPVIPGEDIRKILDGQTILNIYEHQRLNTNALVLGTSLKNGDILLLQSSVQAIEEGVEITKDFYLYIGIISLIIGAIIALVFSKIITRPIIKLNDVAYKMAALDFSHKYEVSSNDEIGELGKTINYLSDKLDTTITELNTVNEKLKKDIEKERSLEKMRKEFVSNVSHELKTPISLVYGYAEGLKDNVVKDEETKKFYCDVIIDEADKMGKLVKDLLDLSQLESGQFSLDSGRVDINGLVKKAIEKYSPILKGKNINIIVETMEEGLNIEGDMARIEQVIVNFINNGINHIDESRILKVSVREIEGKARVSVFNSGNAIPEEEMDKIWESFYKVDKARTRKYGGTGLGLSIVKRILELHKGSFGVSNLDKGVEFWFELELV